MHIKRPYFTDLWLHIHLSGIPFCIIFSSPFPLVCVHCLSFLRNFGLLLSRNSMVAWDLTLADYCLLQFHRDITTASVFSVILCFLDCDCKRNWKSLWCLGCFLDSLWNHNTHPKLISQESTNQCIGIGHYWRLNFLQESPLKYGVELHPFS